jgi:hypothetical protein
LAVASRAFSRKPDSEGRRGVVMLGNDYGTVSSTLIALSRKTPHSVFQYAPGPPCDHPYDDLSALLRQVLSTERSRKAREANGEAEKAAKAKAKAAVGRELAKKSR